MSTNKDLKYTLKFAKGILPFMGAWPIPITATLSEKIKLRFRNIITYSLLLFTIVPGLLRIFLIEKTAVAKIKILGPLLNCSMQIAKYTILLHRSDEVWSSIDAIKKDWMNATEEDLQILRSKAKVARRLVLISAVTMYSSGLGYRTLIPFLREKIVTADNVTLRPLAMPCYLIFFDEQVTPTYEIVFVLQFFAGFAVYSILSSSCGMCAFLVLHVCSQSRMLVNKLKRLTKGENLNDGVVQQRMTDIVTHQIKIQRFLADIETITEYVCLIETMGSTLLICIVGYYLVLEWGHSITVVLVYLILFSAFTFNIFIFCYISQLLDDENKNVGQTSITIDWYRLPKKKAQYLTLIIAMSTSPKMLTAGKMVDMSLATFTDIMKVSMTYLNFFRNVI